MMLNDINTAQVWNDGTVSISSGPVEITPTDEAIETACRTLYAEILNGLSLPEEFVKQVVNKACKDVEEMSDKEASKHGMAIALKLYDEMVKRENESQKVLMVNILNKKQKREGKPNS